MFEEEIEELNEEDYDIEESIELNLGWTCKNCGEDNIEYDIPYEKEIICTCRNCNKKYSVWYCPY